MDNNRNQLFRNKTLEKISSPEALHDYMRVTSPRLWMILSAIVVLLAGFVIYAASTRMESTEKVLVRVTENKMGNAMIPAGREDLIKVGMEVRVDGKTGWVSQIDNTQEKVLLVTFDREPPTDSSYYAISLGESMDVQAVDENGQFNQELLYAYVENGIFFIMDYGYQEDLLKPIMQGNIRARFWTENYGQGDGKVTLEGGQLATITGIQQTVVTRAYIQMDSSEGPIEPGTYEGEIVTETTTPISFLLN